MPACPPARNHARLACDTADLPACLLHPSAGHCRDKAGGRFVVKRPLLESSKPAKRLAALHCDATAAAMSVAAAQAFNAAAGEVCGRVEYLEGENSRGASPGCCLCI